MNPSLLIARITLAVIMTAHAIGKIVAGEAFAEKFNLPPTVIVLLTSSELAGAAGVLLGGLPVEPWARWATRLGVLSIAIGQIGAVVVVHWPRFFYFSGGAEYNYVLLAMCLLLVVGHERCAAPDPLNHSRIA